MYPRRLWFVLIAFFLLASACAQGEIDGNNPSNNGGGQQDVDATGGGDVRLDGSPEDALAPDAGSDTRLDVANDIEPDADPDDTGRMDATDAAQSDGGTDIGPADSGTDDATQTDSGSSDTGDDADSGGPCAQVTCSSGVCDPATGSCVECLADSDCGSGVCRASDHTCVGCATDADCGGQGICHDSASVCISSCCDETVQESFSGVGYSHNYFDIDVTPGGEPSIIFGDSDNEELEFAQSVNGQWLSQTIPGGTTSNTGVDVRIALNSAGQPHVIASHYGSLKHFWRDAQGWNSYDLVTTSADSGYVDIAIDGNDTVHMVALLDYGDQIRYATYDAQGQRTGEDLSLPGSDPNPPVWTNIATTSVNTPVISFQIGLDKTLIIAEKPGSSWQYETAGSDVAQVHGLTVDHNDEPVVSYRRNSTNDGLRLLRRSGQQWNDILVVDDPDHGYSSDVAIGPLGDPHIIYMANGSGGQYDNPMYYARWNGAAWESIQVAGVDRAFYPRIVVDDTRTPHVVVYDPPRDAVEYVRLDTL